MSLRTKSVWSKVSEEDGLRILVTRFHGRGLPKENRDVWMANLGPSETLLHQFQGGEISWAEFQRRYRKELWADSEVDADNDVIKNRGQKFTLRLIKHIAQEGSVTLLCHCADDEEHCHRHVLKALIESSKI